MGRVSHVRAAGTMRIAIITPAPPDSRYGNRITAVRWARILRRLRNRVSISQMYDGKPYDLLVALHARKSHSSIINFRRHNPSAPIIVALTGTDLYRDIRTNQRAQESLEVADRIVVLQPKAMEELAQYDPNLVVGILGGGAGTTYDAFRLIHDAQSGTT